MRILYFANNRLGLEILKYLRAEREEIVGLVVHPPERQRFTDEIIAASGLRDTAIFDAGELHESAMQDRLRALEPSLGLCVMFGYVLGGAFLEDMRCPFVNLHPALLPWNRGAYPNLWSIVEGTPAGVTLHFMDAGIDTGDIIAQQEVEVLATDTGETLYRRLEHAALDLFMDTWPLLRSGQAPRRRQDPDAGTSHRVSDVHRIDEIRLDREYRAGELIDLLRARTFPPHAGAWFRKDGKKIHIRIDLTESDDEE